VTKILSLLFIILWSSAFISTKIIVTNASPLASLSFRFAIVAMGFLLFMIITNEKININKKLIINASISGILFHGMYLGGVFYSISIGMSASIAALIVSMQPILTNIFAGPILNENVTWRHWLGIFFGFIGAILVLGYDVGIEIPLNGFIFTFISILAVTVGTLWQKKISEKLPLSTSNFYQAISASIFLFLLMLLFEESYMKLNTYFILSISWQIIAISFGAFTILMYLIKVGTASKTSNLFFLIPPVSAFMAWTILDEKITYYDIAGFLVASLGVYITTRIK
jgi:drug/metabolite transporter (DMT)-like permease